MVDFLREYLIRELGIAADSVTENQGHINLYAEDLAKSLNRFYGSQDELMDSLLKTDQQMYSFLTGVYFRFGESPILAFTKFKWPIRPKNITVALNC